MHPHAGAATRIHPHAFFFSKAAISYEGVIPKPRVFTSGARDPACSTQWSFVTDAQSRAVVEENSASSQAIPRLHNDQLFPFPRLVHTHHRHLDPPSLEHKNKLVPGFTSRCNLTRLVYYQCFFYPDAAINREKEIKGWRRSKKIKLIESMNPHWHDLAEQWQDVYKPASTKLRARSLAPLVKTRGFGMTPCDAARRGPAKIATTMHALRYNESPYAPPPPMDCPS